MQAIYFCHLSSMDTWECEQSKWTETAKVLKYHQSKIDRESNTRSKPGPTKKRRKDLRNVQINSNDIDYGTCTINHVFLVPNEYHYGVESTLSIVIVFHMYHMMYTHRLMELY